MANEVMVPYEMLDEIKYTVDKTYLMDITSEAYNVESGKEHNNIMGLLKVKRWVFDKEQDIADCFKNVLTMFSGGEESNTLAFIVKRKRTTTEMYFAIKGDNGNTQESHVKKLEKSLKGNFSGTSIERIEPNQQEAILEIRKPPKKDEKGREASEKDIKSIAVLVNFPSEYSEDHLTQGIEKLLDGIVPTKESEEYTIIFLAKSIPQQKITEIMSGYEELADYLFPLSTFQSQNGLNYSENKSNTDSFSKVHGRSHTESKTTSFSSTLYNGLVLGRSRGKSDTVTDSEVYTKAKTEGETIGASWAGTVSYKSYAISNLLEKLEKEMKRIDQSKATGLWEYSTYVLSNNSQTSLEVADYICSLTQGKESFFMPPIIKEWQWENSKVETKFDKIFEYVKHFSHPEFKSTTYASIVTPTYFVATEELSHVIAFPQHSLQGIPVQKSVSFGREPHFLGMAETENNLEIGSAYHMYQVHSNRVGLSIDELSKHTFITGSTGSGKSNTVYTILKNLLEKNVHFLVIEPAKGEYWKVFKNRKDVRKFGTNPNIEEMELLRINPFQFPVKTIHVLEHIDRLVEIFNVCFPMYAAMPAILKDAIELAYEKAGWNLETSQNQYDNSLFPDFKDVLEKIGEVMKNSEYSAENKGNYNGALKTRIRSLTKGINRLLFTANGLDDEILFDSNTIVDLSRIGSSETKALIMGILVLKLQEYRMDSQKTNANLHHVTVLEEAHHLLKRSSSVQSSEGANLLEKSVEMLANSIAEMRTYGEGFIIADQAPNLMDMSVIRNTNTKIIHRLPDYSDRELVGKAIALNENQIEELTKLETGVAVLSQSNWIEPVLCKVDFTEGVSDGKELPHLKTEIISNDKLEKKILDFIVDYPSNLKSLYELYHQVLHSDLSTDVKINFIRFCSPDIETNFIQPCHFENEEEKIMAYTNLGFYLLRTEKDLVIFLLRIITKIPCKTDLIYEALEGRVENA